jgi:hypothetical protein
MYADYLSRECPLVFRQEDVPRCRERIALGILNRQAII